MRCVGPVVGFAALAMGLTSCASTNTGTASGASVHDIKKCTVALIPKNTDNPYFAAVAVGARDAASALGGKVEYQGSAQATVPDQLRIIQSISQQRVCLMAVSGIDPNSLSPALKSASKRGTRVVTYDADVDKSARAIFVNQVDNTAVGVAQLKILAKDMNYTGDFGIVSAQISASNQNAWIAAIKQELKKRAYARMHLLKTVYGNDDAKTSYDQAVSLLRGFAQIRGVLSPTPTGLDASAKAITDLKLTGKVKLTGLGFPPGDAQLLKSGAVSAYVLWSPVDLGYLTYYAAADLIQGKITGKEGDVVDAGRLGKRVVGRGGVLLLGPPAIYTKYNVNQHLKDFRTK